MSRSLLLFWEYARHFLLMLSQFSNKSQAEGMHRLGWPLSLEFCDGLTEAGTPGIRFPSGKHTKTFQGETAQVPTQQ